MADEISAETSDDRWKFYRGFGVPKRLVCDHEWLFDFAELELRCVKCGHVDQT